MPTRLVGLLFIALAGVWIAPAAVYSQAPTSRSGAAGLAEQARWLAKSGRLIQAASLFDHAIDVDPRHVPAYIGLSAVLARLKLHRRAIGALGRATRLLPRDASIKTQLGLHLAARGSLERARQVLGQALAADPNAHEAALILGEVCLRLRRWPGARTALTVFLARRPGAARAQDRRARLGLALALLGQKRYTDARREIDALQRAHPREVAPRVLLATLHVATGRCPRALRILAGLEQHTGQVPSILYNRAVCQRRLRRHEAALAALARYGALRPGRPETTRLRAKIHVDRGELQRALAAYRKAAERGAEVRVEMGQLLLRMGRARRARALAERVLSSAPPAPAQVARAARLVLGQALLRLKLPELVAKRLEPLTGAARDGEVLHLLGQAYRALGKLELAVQRFDAALGAGHARARSSAVEARTRLARRYGRDRDLGRAEAVLLRALKIAPREGATWQQLGLIRMLRKDHVGARLALRAALDQGAAGATTHHLLGRAHLALGELDAGERHYQLALKAAHAGAGAKVRSAQVDRIELESALLAARRGSLEGAIRRLEVVAARQGAGAATRSLALARFKLGLRHLERRAYRQAITALAGAEKLQGSLSSTRRRDLSCALALAHANAGQSGPALRSLARARRAGGCTFSAYLDPVGSDYLRAFSLYRAGGEANLLQATRSLAVQLRRASGAGKATVTRLQRAVHEALAIAAFKGGTRRRARAALAAASRLGGTSPTLEHNVAVLDALEGRWGAAARVFTRLGSAPPQARIGLGLYHVQRGDQAEALRQLELARKLGLDAPWLRARIALLRGVLDHCSAGSGRAP